MSQFRGQARVQIKRLAWLMMAPPLSTEVGLCCVEVERLERSQPFIGAENGPADCQTLVESGRLDQLVAKA